MNDFVFATLPRDFMNIANKFPQVASALKNVGVTRMSDAGQLEVAKVSLPGLAEAAGLAGVANLAIADLTKAEASKVPTNMVFARGGENNLDLNVKLSISNQGTAVQTLNTIQGHPLTLAIKPDQPAKTVKGYLIFKSNHVGEATTEGKLETPNVIPGLTRNLSPRNLTWIPAFAGMTRGAVENENDFAVIPGLTRNLSPKVLSRTEIPDQVRNDSRGVGNDSNTVQSGFISLLATPANAAEVKATVDVGNTANSASNSLLNDQNSPDLVLSQFEYKDNGNGVWTADVASPLVLGQYELRTVVEYKNVTVKPETVSMVVVVDPEGYVFQKLSNGKETRIPDATVSIYWLNPATNKYELWSAKNFRQENPQITDVTGRYAYLVPAGDYYLTAKAVGYGDYQSEIFKVQENKGVFMNIELKEKFSLAGWFNLQTILLGGILAVMSGILLTLILLLVAKRRKVV